MPQERLPVFTVSLMVTGNLLGAGILALPVNLGPAGLLPAMAGICLIWALMLASSFILADQKELTSGEAGGLPSFFALKLGPTGSWLAVGADLIILYGVLTAYLVGVSSILVHLFDLASGRLVTLAYFAVAATLATFGSALLRSCNAVIMLTMFASFLILVGMILPHVEPVRALPMQWGYLPVALPVVLTAFLYHNLVPTVCRELKNDRRAIRRAMFYGSAVGLAMNLLWTLAVFCALPMSGDTSVSLLTALEQNLPATIPLGKLLGSSFFTDTALIFAVLSMTAAFMANGTALCDFLRDLLSSSFRLQSPRLVWVLSFLPPLVVSLVYPDVFLVAMNIVGGVGVCIIFGILPSLLLLRGPAQGRTRLLGWTLLLLFAAILVFELGQEFGLTGIHPDVEYWQVQPLGG